jgi:hypothetical protein
MELAVIDFVSNNAYYRYPSAGLPKKRMAAIRPVRYSSRKYPISRTEKSKIRR